MQLAPRPFGILISLVAATAMAAQPAKPTNRLAKETSPYLLQHAHNPVDWFPWGPEALEKAKREGKLPSHQERVYISQYNNRRITYLNLLFSMASHGWPRSLLRLLLRPALRKSLGRPELNRLYRGIYDLYRGVALLPHRVKSMANGGLVTVENPGM